MAVGPAERSLDDGVDLVEIKVGSELEPTPERRARLLEVDPDPIGDDIRTARVPSRRRLARTFAACHGVTLSPNSSSATCAPARTCSSVGING
jgi:hypothetical protein